MLTLLVLCQWVTAEMQQDGAIGVPKADMEAAVAEELRRLEEDHARQLKAHEARIQELIGELEQPPDEAAGRRHLTVMADGFIGGGGASTAARATFDRECIGIVG